MKTHFIILVSLFLVSNSFSQQPAIPNVCSKGGFEECIKEVQRLQAEKKDNEANALIENEICPKEPEKCFKFGTVYMYAMDYEETLRWANPACKAKYQPACKAAEKFSLKHAANKKMGALVLKKTEPFVKEVREKSASKKIDYDMSSAKWSAGNMEKEIVSKRALGKRILFPVKQCGVFLPSFSQEKWSAIIECKDESPRVWYKVVVDSAMASTWPKRFKTKLDKPAWFQGTIVELRPTGVTDAMVIVTDKSE